MPNNQVFDDFDDEQGQNLLGSLHLDADEEPTRRGAASRANSVRFDEATLHSSNWGQNTRHSGEFDRPARPGSGLGGSSLMERTYSHKSDGRHSSAGHSVHSFHSVPSGRTSSLGLDLLLGTRDDDDSDSSPVDVAGPPPGLLFLGSFPSIVRCWLTTQYSHDTLLYAVVCSGSQKSTVDYTLLKELDLLDEARRNINGFLRIELPVYFAEATVSQSHSRSSSPSRQVPYITVDFKVTGEPADVGENNKDIRIFIGSDVLRSNSADLLLSQNRMSLFGNGGARDRLSVPFVRPEDESSYKHIATVNAVPEKPKLNATAPEFVTGDSRPQTVTTTERADASGPQSEVDASDVPSPFSPMTTQSGYQTKSISTSVPSDSGSERPHKDIGGNAAEGAGKENAEMGDEKRRESVGGIWGSWRQGASSDSGHRENGLSGYLPAVVSRGGRSMKILKPQKSASLSASARTGQAYEPAAPARSSGDVRRKSQGAASALEPMPSPAGPPTTVRWENVRRIVSAASPGAAAAAAGASSSTASTPTTDKSRTPATRTNPVGGASAFSWMTPGGGIGKPLESPAGKPKTPTPTA